MSVSPPTQWGCDCVYLCPNGFYPVSRIHQTKPICSMGLEYIYIYIWINGWFFMINVGKHNIPYIKCLGKVSKPVADFVDRWNFWWSVPSHTFGSTLSTELGATLLLPQFLRAEGGEVKKGVIDDWFKQKKLHWYSLVDGWVSDSRSLYVYTYKYI